MTHLRLSLFLSVFLLTLVTISQATLTLNTPNPNNPQYIYPGAPLSFSGDELDQLRYSVQVNNDPPTALNDLIGGQLESNVIYQFWDPIFPFKTNTFISTSGNVLYIPMTINTYKDSTLLKTFPLRLVSACDFLSFFDQNPRTCASGSICHPTNAITTTIGHCECNNPSTAGSAAGPLCNQQITLKKEELSVLINGVHPNDSTIYQFHYLQNISISANLGSAGEKYYLSHGTGNSVIELTEILTTSSSGPLANYTPAPSPKLIASVSIHSYDSSGILLWKARLPPFQLVNNCFYSDSQTKSDVQSCSRNHDECNPAGSRCNIAPVTCPTLSTPNEVLLTDTDTMGIFQAVFSASVTANTISASGYFESPLKDIIPATIIGMTPSGQALTISVEFAKLPPIPSTWYFHFFPNGFTLSGQSLDSCSFKLPFSIGSVTNLPTQKPILPPLLPTSKTYTVSFSLQSQLSLDYLPFYYPTSQPSIKYSLIPSNFYGDGLFYSTPRTITLLGPNLISGVEYQFAFYLLDTDTNVIQIIKPDPITVSPICGSEPIQLGAIDKQQAVFWWKFDNINIETPLTAIINTLPAATTQSIPADLRFYPQFTIVSIPNPNVLDPAYTGAKIDFLFGSCSKSINLSNFALCLPNLSLTFSKLTADSLLFSLQIPAEYSHLSFSPIEARLYTPTGILIHISPAELITVTENQLRVPVISLWNLPGGAYSILLDYHLGSLKCHFTTAFVPISPCSSLQATFTPISLENFLQNGIETEITIPTGLNLQSPLPKSPHYFYIQFNSHLSTFTPTTIDSKAVNGIATIDKTSIALTSFNNIFYSPRFDASSWGICAPVMFQIPLTSECPEITMTLQYEPASQIFTPQFQGTNAALLVFSRSNRQSTISNTGTGVIVKTVDHPAGETVSIPSTGYLRSGSYQLKTTYLESCTISSAIFPLISFPCTTLAVSYPPEGVFTILKSGIKLTISHPNLEVQVQNCSWNVYDETMTKVKIPTTPTRNSSEFTFEKLTLSPTQFFRDTMDILSCDVIVDGETCPLPKHLYAEAIVSSLRIATPTPSQKTIRITPQFENQSSQPLFAKFTTDFKYRPLGEFTYASIPTGAGYVFNSPLPTDQPFGQTGTWEYIFTYADTSLTGTFQVGEGCSAISSTLDLKPARLVDLLSKDVSFYVEYGDGIASMFDITYHLDSFTFSPTAVTSDSNLVLLNLPAQTLSQSSLVITSSTTFNVKMNVNIFNPDRTQQSCPLDISVPLAQYCPITHIFTQFDSYPNTIDHIKVILDYEDEAYRNVMDKTLRTIQVLGGNQSSSTISPNVVTPARPENPFVYGVDLTFLGAYRVSFSYLQGCSVEYLFTSIPPTEYDNQILKSHGYINQSRQAVLSWKLPTQRLTQYQTNPTLQTIQYQFTIHPSNQVFPEKNNPTTSIPDIPTVLPTPFAILSGSAYYSTLSTFTAITHFPETITYATLDLPNIPKSFFKSGFYLSITPVTPLGSGIYQNEDQIKLTWAFSASKFTPIPPLLCPSGMLWNEYTLQCVLSAPLNPTSPAPQWAISPLIVSSQCKLVCPVHFVQNADCTQCQCISAMCRTYTRSYQIKFDVPTNWSSKSRYFDQQSSLFQNYVRDYLSSTLGLSQLPPRTSFGNLYYGIPTGTVGSSNNVPNIGPESLFIQFMNHAAYKATGRYHFDNLIITISTTPSTSNASPIDRFNELESRLKLLGQTRNAGNPLLPLLTDAYVPFPISFIDNDSRIKRIDYSTAFGSSSSTSTTKKATTLCQSHAPNSTIRDTCPAPTKTLLSSQFWSSCSATPSSNPQLQTLLPVCFDYFAQETTSSSSWCQQGWFNYPSVSSIASCSTGDQYKKPTDGQFIPWTPNQDVVVIDSGQSVLLTWTWDNTFNPTLTLDVLYYTPSSTYSQVLVTVLASNGAATVKIPENVSGNSITSRIRLRCTQFAKYQTDPNKDMKLQVPFTNKCSNVQCQGANKYCLPTTGQCACRTGYSQALTSEDCTLPCTGFCFSDDFCVVESPNVCGKCPEGKLPPLCSTPDNCQNDSITGLNQNCSKHGFITLGNDGICSTTCKCVDHQFWSGSKCDLCLLINDDPTKSADQQLPKCVADHTDFDKTILDISSGGLECGGCSCLAGYSGQYCEIQNIRGDVTYERDVEQQTPSPFTLTSLFDPNQTEDPNGLHFVSEQGRIVLERDMALSLGLEAEAILITKIVQTTTSPQSDDFIIAQAKTTTTTIITYSVHAGQSNLNDLTNAWNGMKDTYPQLPVGNTEVSSEIGSANSIGNAQQPDQKEAPCDPEIRLCDCSPADKLANDGQCPLKPSKGSSNTAIIVGVVVGVGIVILIFVGAIATTKWAKKNQRWCFKPQKSKQGNDDLELTSGATSITIGTQTSGSNQTTQGSNKSAISGSATAVDLIEITDHGEDLPSGWSKHKHAVTGQIMYINQIEMKSQKHSPLENGDHVGENGW